MQVMLENVALRAQKDAPIDEVKTLRSRLNKGLKRRKQSATAAVLEEEEECIRFKGLAISSTSGSNTPLKTPVKTVMRSPEASGSETPVCQKTRASVYNKLKANLAKDWPSLPKSLVHWEGTGEYHS
ncbi:hypothetical protein CgunFtcFv8_020225 [Champsocephalus gunnari]|uniref:Uncharacterized protein n=1 Tax=Champsocephalus gunnari TaxID=52237 RepID=A0AAN8EAC8_CHAGU|nr:hypothetical protein CgunFtcFv8_020225 [Champsocephalus gunnari]